MNKFWFYFIHHINCNINICWIRCLTTNCLINRLPSLWIGNKLTNKSYHISSLEVYCILWDCFTKSTLFNSHLVQIHNLHSSKLNNCKKNQEDYVNTCTTSHHCLFIISHFFIIFVSKNILFKLFKLSYFKRVFS